MARIFIEFENETIDYKYINKITTEEDFDTRGEKVFFIIINKDMRGDVRFKYNTENEREAKLLSLKSKMERAANIEGSSINFI